MRERMAEANGNTDNHVMWRGGIGISEIMRGYAGGAMSSEAKALSDTAYERGWKLFVDWVAELFGEHDGIQLRSTLPKHA